MKVESSWDVREGVVRRVTRVPAQRPQPMPLQPRWRVLRLVQLGMTRSRAIAERLELPITEVRRHLESLRRARKVECHGTRWVPRC